MNRSRWASGSWYTPSLSIGFCVATTKNGCGTWWVTPPIVTCCSAITSSSADWTLAGARLISSVEQEVDEHRAELDVERLAAAAVDAGADDVGRQQVGRELDAGERAADDVGERLGGERLGEAGHRLEQAVAAAEQADEQALEQPGLADDHLAQLEEDPLDGVGDGFACGVPGWVGWVARRRSRRIRHRRVVTVGEGFLSARHATLTVVRRSATRESRTRLGPVLRARSRESGLWVYRPPRSAVGCQHAV